MNWQAIPHLLPYIIALTITLGVAAYTYRRRYVIGAGEFFFLMLAHSAWTLSYIFKLFSVTLENKIFWENAQFAAMFAIGGCSLWFVRIFTGQAQPFDRRLRVPLLAIATVFVLLVYTDSWHHWVRAESQLGIQPPFNHLVYPMTSLIWLIIIYVYTLIGVCIWLLVQTARKAQTLYRAQYAMLIIGIALPFIGAVLTLIEPIIITGQHDLMPFTFAIGNLIIAFGLLQHRVFDVAPVALEIVFESMRDWVVVLDNQERILDANRMARQVLRGNDKSALIGQPLAHVFPQWSSIRPTRDDALEASLEIQMNIDGKPHTFDLSTSLLLDNQGNYRGRALVARDTTALRRTQQALVERQNELEAANGELAAINEQLLALTRMKDEFVSNVSHELRTPIASLKLQSHLLQRKPDQQALTLERIEREMQRLDTLIEDLLRLSRLDQNRERFHPQRIDLNKLIVSYVDDREALAESRQIRLVRQLAPSALYSYADGGLLGIVLSILMTNALNYTPPGGCITLSTQQYAKDNSTWVSFAVSDTGPGISPDEQHFIFTRFFRGMAARELSVTGTGLGLAIAHEIITLHQGQIHVASTGIKGQGTTFTVALRASLLPDTAPPLNAPLH